MNFWNEDFMYNQALATKQKRDQIIEFWELYPCKVCWEYKKPSDFVKRYMENSFVGKYQFLHECKSCKRHRMITQRQWARSTIEWALWVVYKQLIKWATKRNISFDISVQDLLDLRYAQQWKCYYTGYEMEYQLSYFKQWSQMEKSRFIVSCDRLISSQWYEKNNIILCCSVVNRMKWNLSVDEFILLCKDVFNFAQ
jgi:hypothetical protein